MILLKKFNKLKYAFLFSILLHFILIILLFFISLNKLIHIKYDNISSLQNSISIETQDNFNNYLNNKKYNKKINTNKTKSDIEKKHLTKSDIEKKHLTKSDIEKKHLTKSDIEKKHLTKSDIEKKHLTKSDIEKKHLTKSDIEKKHLTKSDIEKKHLTKSDIEKFFPKNVFFKKNKLLNNINNKEKDNLENITYANQIQNAIKNKFYNWKNYKGLTCTLFITLSPNGTLINVKIKNGNHNLCESAIIALRQANIPKPPNQNIYQIFKEISLDFNPK